MFTTRVISFPLTETKRKKRKILKRESTLLVILRAPCFLCVCVGGGVCTYFLPVWPWWQISTLFSYFFTGSPPPSSPCPPPACLYTFLFKSSSFSPSGSRKGNPALCSLASSLPNVTVNLLVDFHSYKWRSGMPWVGVMIWAGNVTLFLWAVPFPKVLPFLWAARLIPTPAPSPCLHKPYLWPWA